MISVNFNNKNQYQFLMLIDIPIIVTKGDTKSFKMASPRLIQQLKQKRHPSLPKPRNTNLQPRHQTLDPDKQVTGSRTRRISSSAAAKRFPKDFFKDQNCLHPIKSIRPKHKQYEPCLLDTFSHKNFLVPHPEPQNTNKQQSDTPKFKQKQSNESTKKPINDRLRNKVEQLIQQTPTNKYNTASQAQNKYPLLQIFDPQKQQTQPFGTIPFISNFNVTLGKKVALSFLAQKGQKSKKKREDQKQNNEGIDSGRRESNGKAQGFRIRKKLQN